MEAPAPARLGPLPLWLVPTRPDVELWRAYHECFTSPAGDVVLYDLYQATCLTQGEDVRHLGRLDVYQGIIANMQAWERYRRQPPPTPSAPAP